MSRHVSITPFSVTRSDAGNRGVTSSISCKTVTNQAALFVFGDSLFEAGNNNYVDSLPGFRSNCWPNGKSTFQFPTGRVSDGRIMIDFIGTSSVSRHLYSLKLFRQKSCNLFDLYLCLNFCYHNNACYLFITWQLNMLGYHCSHQIYNHVYSKSQLTYGLNFATTAVGVLAGTLPGVVMRRLKLGPVQWCHGSWDKKN